MAFFIVMFIVLLPLYGLLIWSFFNPEGSMSWGKAWMYKERPEPSEAGIIYIRSASVFGLLVLTIWLIIAFVHALN
ncbi:uncharacterized BrkB/YihY/UPF0761 family membrane protein [Paenibacillus phyllosphaerae]|uniref:Uncharacterized BrkB/YihY/UPF0761 family membrane protein n=1 Tax=Paenibacillus phyllosphaerae TaxID=274593 RepID=A0A7W5FPD3_9BACL|nr:hypothetical protein [Paenibacillus phyllosphaerae]MBB3111914.1 uncharacterized BrkB/YihY/UPF0761 family membrane protein [Paenibacillus phyllosphaerae]